MKQLILSLLLLAAPALRAATYTLAQCLDAARANNRELRSAALAIDAADEGRRSAAANRLPQISANVMAFQAFDKLMKSDGTYPQELAALAEVNPAFGQLAGQPYSISELNRAYTIAISAIEPIYTGGKVTAGVKLSALQTDVARLQARMKEKDVLQKVAENYWNIASIVYNIRTIDAAKRQLDEVERQVGLLVKTGMTTRNALLQVRLRQQELASDRLKADNGRQLLTLLLRQQTGIADEDFNIDVPDEPATDEQPAYTEAADSREEIALAAKNVEAQQLQIKLKRADMMPTLAIGVMGYNMGLGGLSAGAKQYIDNNQTNGLALATLSLPISEWWGGAAHSTKQQRRALEQARCDYEDVREKIAIDNRSAWLNLTEARAQIDIARASVEEADENYRMARQQYTAGTQTIADLLDAETLARQAHNNLNANAAAYQIRLADYLRKTR